MRYFLLSLFLLTSCVKQKAMVQPKEELTFGDYAEVVSGPYKGANIQVFNEIEDQFKAPCEVHQYYANVVKNGLSKADYICHEGLRVLQ